MASLVENRNRNIIPRWRPIGTKDESAELTSLPSGQPTDFSDLDELERRVSDWRSTNGFLEAAELVSTALVFNQPDSAQDAAEYIISRAPDSASGLLLQSRTILAGADEETGPGNRIADLNAQSRHAINSSRLRLVRFPHNPLLWTNLGLSYSNVGLNHKARRALNVARGLAPSNRLILRAYSRFLVHDDEPEEALHILRKSSLLRGDPWILAAHIAISAIAERNPVNIRVARQMLDLGDLSPIHTSELASALGTIELYSGAHRKARQLFRHSLEQPTENALAQAMWIANRTGSIPQPMLAPHGRESFEASALLYSEEERWNEAVDASELWQQDEPFSVRPAILGSYLSAVVLKDYERSAKLASQAHKANPGEFVVVNNLAYAKSLMNQGDEAVALLETVDFNSLSTKQHIYYLATSGLIKYRMGQPVEGQALYQQAIKAAEKAGLKNEAALAALHLAREEKRLGSEGAAAFIEKAKSLWGRIEPDKLKAARVLLNQIVQNRSGHI